MHAECLSRFVDGVELAALYEPVPEAARRAEAEVRVRTVGDEAALFGSGIDAVAICSSTPTHPRYIKMAAGAGIAAFCEKPISLDLAEAAEAVQAAGSAGIPLVLGFNRRLDPGRRAVRDGVARGEIGTPWQVVIISRDPEPPPADYLPVSGGLFRDMAIHDFDMARYLLGEEVVEVNVTATSLVIPEAAALGDVDLAFISLRYESGALGMIVNSRAAAYGYGQRIEVNGSKGRLSSVDPPVRYTVWRPPAGSPRRPSITFSSSATGSPTFGSGASSWRWCGERSRRQPPGETATRPWPSPRPPRSPTTQAAP